MEDYKKRFLEISVLGRETELDNSDDVIYRCIGKAYDDMIVGGRRFLNKGTKKKFCKDFKSKLEEKGFQFSRNLIGETEDLFKENQALKPDYAKASTYGLAQKVVNMSFKYFYIFDSYLNVNIDYTNCDCPLDSTILDRLRDEKDFSTFFDEEENILWTTIENKDYENCQKIIDVALKEKDDFPKDNGRMAYDWYWIKHVK